MPKLVDVIIVNRVRLPETLSFYMILKGRSRFDPRRGGCASAGADAQAQGRLGWLKAWLVEGWIG